MQVADNLNKLFERIKFASLFYRIFRWSNIIAISHDAYAEYSILMEKLSKANEEINNLNVTMAGLKERIRRLEQEKIDYNIKIESMKKVEESYNNMISEKRSEISKLEEALRGANEQISSLKSEIGTLKNENNRLISENNDAVGNIAKYKESDYKNMIAVDKLNREVEIWKGKYEEAKTEITQLNKKIAEYIALENGRISEYNTKVSELVALKKQLDDDRAELIKEREEICARQLAVMKEKWVEHERSVEEKIKKICNRYQIEYYGKEQVPFKGKPDNTIKICDELVIFDAKSPESDDLSNFPLYIKSQAEAAKKYAKEENVRRDIFLVVPSNTLDSLEEHYYPMGDYNVYVIGCDSLLPVILNLKRLEDYEFTEQLSPEERDNICRVIGKFSHAAKRAIQLDEFMCTEFSEVLNDCNSLPDDFIEKIEAYERSEKLNPPMEKRSKAISDKEIQRCGKTLRQFGDAYGIEIDNGTKDAINGISIYRDDDSG